MQNTSQGFQMRAEENFRWRNSIEITRKLEFQMGRKKYRNTVAFFPLKVEGKRKSKSAKKDSSRKEKSKNAGRIDVTVYEATRSIGTFFKGTNVVKYEMTLKITKDHLRRFLSPRAFPHAVRNVTKLLRAAVYASSLFFPLLSLPILSSPEGKPRNDKHSLSIRKFHICAQQQKKEKVIKTVREKKHFG